MFVKNYTETNFDVCSSTLVELSYNCSLGGILRLIEWLSEMWDALTVRVSNVFWKGQSGEAQSLQDRIEVAPPKIEAEEEIVQLSEPKEEEEIQNDSSFIQVKEILSVLNSSKIDEKKFNRLWNNLPEEIKKRCNKEIKDLADAIDLAGMERTKSTNIALVSLVLTDLIKEKV